MGLLFRRLFGDFGHSIFRAAGDSCKGKVGIPNVKYV